VLSLILGFAFLYVPILSLVIFSFNESQLVTVWGGFSTKWYGELLRNREILGAAWISLKVAVISATLSVVLGTLAALVLVRFGGFWGKPILRGMTTAPLVMPEVITGLSLLLLFVTLEQLIGWPAGRGMTTIIIAHVTFAMAFVTVVVQSRLAQIDERLLASVTTRVTRSGWRAASATANIPPSDQPTSVARAGRLCKMASSTRSREKSVPSGLSPKPGRSRAITSLYWRSQGNSGSQLRLSKPQP